jgi:uncharacterized protein YcnI
MAAGKALGRLVAASVVALLALLIGAAPAGAHVTVTSDHSWRGGVATVTFMVPNESETGSPTTGLTVTLPTVTSAHTELMPGWKVALDHDIATGTFRSVTWTAAAGGGIPADQFALFRIQITLPDSETARFPATQTYADGTAVHWDQPALPDGSEPEHPAPTLTLTAVTPDAGQAPSPTSASAATTRWLAGAALAVSVLSLAVTALRGRRS